MNATFSFLLYLQSNEINYLTSLICNPIVRQKTNGMFFMKYIYEKKLNIVSMVKMVAQSNGLQLIKYFFSKDVFCSSLEQIVR